MEGQTRPPAPAGQNDPRQGFLATFWGLSETNDEKRIHAAASLVSLLKSKQEDEIEPCQDLSYALKRLVRGLSSSRKCSRLGFAMALSQVLRTFPTIPTSDIFGIIIEELKVETNDSKGEQREVLFGRALAFMSIIRSGRVKQAEGKDLKFLVKGLLQVKKSKSTLRLLCCQGLVQVIEAVSRVEFAEHVWPELEAALGCGWTNATPDVLWLLLVAREHQKSVVDKEFLAHHWDCKNLIHEDNYERLAAVAMFCSSEHPLIHPLCPKLIHESAKKKNMKLFWNSVVNAALLGADKVNRKYLAMQLVPLGLAAAATAEEIRCILSSELVLQLIKNLTHKANLLYPACKQLVEKLVEYVRGCKSGELQMAVLTGLIRPPSSVLFDNLTKTKTVANIISSLNGEAARSLLIMIEVIIRGEDPLKPKLLVPAKKPLVPGPQELETKQRWAAATLARMSVLLSDTEDKAFQINVLQFLMLGAFFTLKRPDPDGGIPQCTKPFIVPISQSLRHTMQETFFSTLNKLSTHHSSAMTSAKDRRPFINAVQELINYAQLLLSRPDIIELGTKWSPEVEESWRKTTAVLAKIHAKHEADEKMNEGHAFQLLFLHCGLQLFKSPESAMEVLDELHTCYNKATAKKRRRSVAPKAETEPEWVDVITDLLLSLLSQDSHLVRVVVNNVFAILCPYVTQTTVSLIIDVIKPEEADDEDGALGFEDVDAAGAESEEEDGSDAGDKDTSSDEESSDEEEEPEPVDDEFRSNMKAALGGAAVDSDQDDDEEELSDLDDEAMFKLDDALAAVLKNKRDAKNAQKEKDKQLKIYRNKCLDLIEILVKSNRSPSILLELVFPLLELVALGHKEKAMKELGTKAQKVLRMVCRSGKMPPDPAVEKEDLPKVFESLLDFSKKVSGLPMMMFDIAGAAMLVVRVLLERESDAGPSPVRTRSMRVLREEKTARPEPGESLLAGIQQLLADTVQSFCTKRDRNIDHKFIQQILEKQATLMWPVTEVLLKCCTDQEVRVFCRSQMCLTLAGMISVPTIRNLSDEEWKPFAGRCVEEMTRALEEVGRADAQKPRYTMGLLSVTFNTLKYGGEHLLKDESSMSGLMDTVEKLRQNQHQNKDCRKVFNRLVGLLQMNRNKQAGKVSKKTKRKSTGETGELDLAGHSPANVKSAVNKELKQNGDDTTDISLSTGKKNRKKRKSVQPEEAAAAAKDVPTTETVSIETNGDETTDISLSTGKKNRKKRKSVLPEEAAAAAAANDVPTTETVSIETNGGPEHTPAGGKSTTKKRKKPKTPTDGDVPAVNGMLTGSDSEHGAADMKTPAKNLADEFASASASKSSVKGRRRTIKLDTPKGAEVTGKKTSPSPGKLRRKSLRSAAKLDLM